MIISGSNSQVLSAELAEITGRELATVEYTAFPDGELKVRIPEQVPDSAVVVASATDSDAYMELLLLQDALRGADVAEVVTVIPYMGYAGRSETEIPASPEAMARAVSSGTDRVLTVNPLDPGVPERFDVPATAVDAADRLAEPLSEALSDPVFVAPGSNIVELAGTVRDAYGRGDVESVEKTRHSSTGVEIEPRDIDVAGRDVVLVDDAVTTGSTMVEAAGALDDRGAARVFVTCIHPVLARNAVLRLHSADIEAIYGTDTLERTVSEVSVAPAIADELR